MNRRKTKRWPFWVGGPLVISGVGLFWWAVLLLPDHLFASEPQGRADLRGKLVIAGTVAVLMGIAIIGNELAARRDARKQAAQASFHPQYAQLLGQLLAYAGRHPDDPVDSGTLAELVQLCEVDLGGSIPTILHKEERRSA